MTPAPRSVAVTHVVPGPFTLSSYVPWQSSRRLASPARAGHTNPVAQPDPAAEPRRLIVGITGASGSIYGIRLLERLRTLNVETHLILSRWGARTLLHETPYSVEQVQRLA